MAREHLLVAILACAPGCSLILDFSDSEAPHDAAIDAVYTADQCAFMEPNNDFASAMAITATDMGPGAICAPDGDAGAGEDHDFYKFTVPANITTVTIAVSFMNRPGGDLDLRLWDATDAMVARSSGFGDGETLICPNTTPPCPTLAAGDYAFEVYPGVAGAVNFYTFSVTMQ